VYDGELIMKKKDVILAVLLVTIWGVNFTVIKLGLGGVPSMLLVADSLSCNIFY